MKQILLALTILTAICISCAKKDASERATEDFVQLEALYQDSDVRVAERALQQYNERIVDLRRRNAPGIDYDQAFGISHGRLFLIYKFTGETNKMNEHFTRSVEAFRRSRQVKGRPEFAFSPQSLAETIEQFDRGLNIRWKRQPK